MRISKYLHSCILVEDRGQKLLIDPGAFSFIEKKVTPDVFTDISIILITHVHGDHVDVNALKTILGINPKAKVLGNADVVKLLEENEIKSENFEEGEKELSGFKIRAISAEHEKLLIQTPKNTAYVVNEIFLHPGDSLNKTLYKLKGIKLLALPIMAPWANMIQIGDFEKSMEPEAVVPIHDGYVKDFFRQRQHEIHKKYLARLNVEFHALDKAGESIEI